MQVGDRVMVLGEGRIGEVYFSIPHAESGWFVVKMTDGDGIRCHASHLAHLPYPRVANRKGV